MRILIIHRELPFPADNGGRLRAAHVARYLVAHHDVELLYFGNRPTVEFPGQAQFRTVQNVSLPPRASRMRRVFSGVPSEVVDLRCKEMSAAIGASVARTSPDVLMVSEPSMAQYLEPYADQVRVMDYLMVQTLSLKRLAAIARGVHRILWRLRWQRSVAYHRFIATMFDLCLVNSQEDLDDLRQHSSRWKRLQFFPNGVNLDDYPFDLAQPVPNTLIYPGSVTYLPNRDAVAFMIDAILPRIQASVPEVKLIVTGALPSDGSAPQNPAVQYTGRVHDVRLPIASAWACTVPLRSGAGGTRYKVLETMAIGTPLISTRIGVEGVDWTDGVNVSIADQPEQFADAVIRVLRDANYRAMLSRNARLLIEQRYDWEVLGRSLSKLLEELVREKAKS